MNWWKHHAKFHWSLDPPSRRAKRQVRGWNLNRAAVFLDRDGVLNEIRFDGVTASPPHAADEVRILPDVRRALERLREARFVLLAVTNQPDVARGELTMDAVTEINDFLQGQLPLDAIYVCPHDTGDDCSCRKPRPGLIVQAARDWNIELDRSCLIGDRWVDIAAAQAAGIDGLLLERSYSLRASSIGDPPADLRPTFVARTLTECVDFILASSHYG